MRKLSKSGLRFLMNIIKNQMELGEIKKDTREEIQKRIEKDFKDSGILESDLI